MKRILMTTALTATIATAAFAVTESELNTIQFFDAGIDTSAMSESDLQIAYTIVTSGDSQSSKIAKLRALSTGGDMDSIVSISEAEMNRLAGYAPNVDLMTISQEQAEAALAVTYGGESESDKAQRVQSILMDENMMTEMAADISAARLNVIQSYAPNVDPSTLSETDVQLIMTFIHGDMSRGEKLSKITSIIEG